MKYDLVLITAIYNEAEYVSEWLDFHILMGVQHFYLYDNMSKDNLREKLSPYIDLGLVTYAEYKPRPPRQQHKTKFIEDYRNDSRWAILTDIDEFIYPVDSKASIIDILTNEYSDYPGVLINWFCFGHNYLEEKKDGLIIENFFRRCKDDEHVNIGDCRYANWETKSIINPEHFCRPGNHYEYHIGGELNVNANKERTASWRQDPIKMNHLIRINHYICKSKEEFLDKSKDHNRNREKQFACWDKHYNEIEDKSLFIYLKYMKDNWVIDNYQVIKNYYLGDRDIDLIQYLKENA